MHGGHPTLNFAEHGAERLQGAVIDHSTDLERCIAPLPSGRPGIRIQELAGIEDFVGSTGTIGSAARSILGDNCRPVRAILFDKTADTNWSLAWHQDRTICVRERRQVPGFGPWTIKQGMQHVAPPFALLSRMVTLRAHIDDVPDSNAPLLIAPGSHRAQVREADIEEVVNDCGVVTCLARAGDIWVYATPIVHASAAAVAPRTRRVLQIDYAAEDLPGGLEWLGV